MAISSRSKSRQTQDERALGNEQSCDVSDATAGAPSSVDPLRTPLPGSNVGSYLKTQPFGFQRLASIRAAKQGDYALFMDPGTGKTLTAFLIILRKWLKKGSPDFKVLIIGPRIALGNWQRQVTQHLSIGHSFFIFDRSANGPIFLEDGISFNAINYELAWRRLDRLKTQWDLILLDECHAIARRSSNQSKALAELSAFADSRLILSGTPFDKQELELWSQFRFLKPSLLGGTWRQFEKKWTRRSGYMLKDRKLKRHMVKSFYEVLSPYVFRISKDDALDLPGETDSVFSFKLTGKADKAYRELENQFETQVDEYISSSTVAIANMIKLQQIAGGFLPIDDGSLYRLEQDKLAALAEYLDPIDRERKVVIFARFRHELKIIQQLMTIMGRTYSVIKGGMKSADVLSAWTSFQEKNEPSTMICQVKAGGISIDLFAADIGIFYSKPYSYREYRQARDRLARLGQKKKVTFIHLNAENTIDDDLQAVLYKKGTNIDEIFRQLRQRRLSYGQGQ